MATLRLWKAFAKPLLPNHPISSSRRVRPAQVPTLLDSWNFLMDFFLGQFGMNRLDEWHFMHSDGRKRLCGCTTQAIANAVPGRIIRSGFDENETRAPAIGLMQL